MCVSMFWKSRLSFRSGSDLVQEIAQAEVPLHRIILFLKISLRSAATILNKQGTLIDLKLSYQSFFQNNPIYDLQKGAKALL